MNTITLTSPTDFTALMRRAEFMGFPCTATLRKGAGRTNAQNRLAQQWAADVSRDLGDRTPEEARGYFKLRHGVPIRREDPAFAAVYDATIRPLPYEAKLQCMMMPIDMPVTRDMSKAELTRYLDSIAAEFSAMGVRLTDPDAARYKSEFE